MDSTAKTADLALPPQATEPHAPGAPAHPHKPGRHRVKSTSRTSRLAVILAAGLLAAAAVTAWLHYSNQFETTDNAYVTGDVHPISSRVIGFISAILVQENQAVSAGQELVRLDDRDARQALDQAKAKLTEAAAQVEQSRADVTQAEAKLAETGASLEKAHADFSRAKELSERHVLSKQDYDAASAAFQTAVAASNEARAALGSAQAKKTLSEAQSVTAQTAVSNAELQLSYTRITAPEAGHIGKKSGETGMEVLPGQPLMALVEDAPWISANFKETQLGRIQTGQSVEFTIDALPGARFHGTVESVAPASGAQFALLPPDNATGNFTKIVQRVPVKILFDPAELRRFAGQIVPGMSVIAKVRVRQP